MERVLSVSQMQQADMFTIEKLGICQDELVKRAGEAVASVIEPIRQEKNKLLTDKAYLDEILKSGAERAERLAYRTLSKVYKKVGLVPRKRG